MNRGDAEKQRRTEEKVFSSASLRLRGENVWLLWQLADSAFPTGGFGHSSGLEAAYQHREVAHRTELIVFLEASLNQLPHGALPFVKAAHEGASEFSEIDWLCDAFTSNHVANRASRGQGQALLASAERSFGGTKLKLLRTQVFDQELPGHLAPAFGAVMAALAIDFTSAARLFVFMQLRGMISAAVRLNVVGPLEAQSIQHGLSARAEEVAGKARNLTLDDIAQTAPLLDLLQGTQDRLYSRLFQS
jgi:urease accessory protein